MKFPREPHISLNFLLQSDKHPCNFRNQSMAAGPVIPSPPPHVFLTEGKKLIINLLTGGNNSVVECNLAKVEVAGSNPVSRSIFLGGIAKW